MKRVIKGIALVIAVFLSVTLITGCGVKEENKTVGLGETFTFDDLEITIGKDIGFDTIDNEFSEDDGKTVVKIPVTVKNLKDETHSLNMFYYKAFGATGTEVGNMSAYFDESLDYAGELRKGASYTKHMYFLYDEDGKYALEFDDWTNKVTVEFNVEKK